MATMPAAVDAGDEYDEFTCFALRAKIAHKTGHMIPASSVTKPMLNSMFAWFTGDFHTDPGRVQQLHPPRIALLQSVILNVMNEHPENGDELSVWEYYDEHVRRSIRSDTPRPMRRDELIECLEAMEECGDQRPWTSKGGDG